MNRHAAALLATCALIAIVAGAPLGASAQPKEVVIGVLYPMSGPNAQPGIDNKPVIEIGTDVANGAADLPFPFYQILTPRDLDKVLGLETTTPELVEA